MAVLLGFTEYVAVARDGFELIPPPRPDSLGQRDGAPTRSPPSTPGLGTHYTRHVRPLPCAVMDRSMSGLTAISPLAVRATRSVIAECHNWTHARRVLD